MNTSVGMKARKKQSSLSQPTARTAVGRQPEVSLLPLENACVRILESDYTGSEDEEYLYWQQRLMNFTKPISLALAECSGPRHFHQHYRHRKDDDTILQPVLGDPFETLAQACEAALKGCRNDLVG